MSYFDTSKLQPQDQNAYQQWQQKLKQYVQQNGGGIPADLSYALAHPDYIQAKPELKADYDLVSGAELPESAKAILKDYHPSWGSQDAGMEKNKGLFSNPETW